MRLSLYFQAYALRVLGDARTDQGSATLGKERSDIELVKFCGGELRYQKVEKEGPRKRRSFIFPTTSVNSSRNSFSACFHKHPLAGCTSPDVSANQTQCQLTVNVWSGRGHWGECWVAYISLPLRKEGGGGNVSRDVGAATIQRAMLGQWTSTTHTACNDLFPTHALHSFTNSAGYCFSI